MEIEIESNDCKGDILKAVALEFMQKLDAIFRRGQFVERIVGDCDE